MGAGTTTVRTMPPSKNSWPFPVAANPVTVVESSRPRLASEDTNRRFMDYLLSIRRKIGESSGQQRVRNRHTESATPDHDRTEPREFQAGGQRVVEGAVRGLETAEVGEVARLSVRPV